MLKFRFHAKLKTILTAKTKVLVSKPNLNSESGFKPNDLNVFRQTVVTRHLEIKLWFKTESLYRSFNRNLR